MAPEPTTAIILCGGRGTRLGSEDKPLLDLGGKPLVAHVIERLAPQVDGIVLSCSRSRDAYRRLGCPVVLDEHSGEGPLGGFVSALPGTATPWLLATPGDVPFLPPDLVAAMAPACHLHGAVVARAGGRRQNLTMLLNQARALALAAFFAAGGRAVWRWLDDNRVSAVEFAASAFHNVNTPADLAVARQRFARRDRPDAGSR